MRKKKEIYLPCELVGMNEKAPTECYIQISKKSQLKWSCFSAIEETITKAQEKIWNRFIRWLSTVLIMSVRDFEPKEWR